MSIQNSISAANDQVYEIGDKVIFTTHGPRGLVEAQGEIVGIAKFPNETCCSIHNETLPGKLHFISADKVRLIARAQHPTPHP